MKDYENMSFLDLKNEHAELNELLEEVEEERAFMLGQEGIHLSSSLVTKYAIEIGEIKENIELVNGLIEKAKQI